MEPEKDPVRPSQSFPWPAALLCTLVSVFGLLSWLKIKPVDSQAKEVSPNKNASYAPKESALILTSKLSISKAVPHQEGTAKVRYKVPGWLKFVINFLTLIAVGWYAYEARKQRVAMENTFNQVQQQTTLMRQQLIGSQAAVVSLNGNGTLSTTPMPLVDTNAIISIGLKNDGHVIANAISMKLKVQVLSLANNKLIGPQWPCDFAIPVLAPGPAAYRACHVSGLSSEDLRLISELKRTIAIDGNYSYENGFGEIKTEPMCFRYSPQVKTPKHGTEEAGVFNCEGFNVMRDRILRELAEK